MQEDIKNINSKETSLVWTGYWCDELVSILFPGKTYIPENEVAKANTLCITCKNRIYRELSPNIDKSVSESKVAIKSNGCRGLTYERR